MSEIRVEDAKVLILSNLNENLEESIVEEEKEVELRWIGTDGEILPVQIFFDDSVQNMASRKATRLHTVIVGSLMLVPGVDYALSSIHNIREALPEIWEGEPVEQQLIKFFSPQQLKLQHLPKLNSQHRLPAENPRIVVAVSLRIKLHASFHVSGDLAKFVKRSNESKVKVVWEGRWRRPAGEAEREGSGVTRVSGEWTKFGKIWDELYHKTCDGI
ncbi:hypothetical protein Droror1_Dr00023759 [Drosera rotundifolia]